MAFNIEQDKEQVSRAFAVQSHADIESISLLDASMSCKVRLEDIKPPPWLAIRFAAEEAVVKENRLTVIVKFAFKICAEGSEAAVVLIRCRFRADYELMGGFQPSAEEIEAFKGGNAVFNCWPYFREFVQTSVTRMEYPPPTIPFLRLVPKRTKTKPVAGGSERAVPEATPVPRVADSAKQGRLTAPRTEQDDGKK